MKFRTGFVTNSSSASFLITNLTNENLTLDDMMDDFKESIERYYQEEIVAWFDQDWGADYKRDFPTFEKFFEKVKEDIPLLYDGVFKPNEGVELECGDHQHDDGYPSMFIHYYDLYDMHSDRFDITMLESHH